ncbi:hypothetical protein BDY21DRAFT_357348 [Lineolata rhizophorae]|uniref:Protein kinase domain-containing protein n=1 Tax=Lineolata rhizophorae TaxID=578093 RepID=A0A6A6NN36_9PEZI|nr:hypothetical protein BDY21DRAFT_357348 [Lineolata rhizophorae]
MDEISKLQRLLEESERRREEAESRALEDRRRREEAESRALEDRSRALEDRRRREEAEELSKASQPRTLQHYLDACHSLNLAIQVVTDPSLTTQGDTTNPTGRIFPRRIIPWDDFPTKQEKIWDQLSIGDLFSSQAAFPSQHQLDYVNSLLQPISSELGLRDFERDVVENAVRKLVEQAYNDLLLRSSLGLQGIVSFESHTNLGNVDDPISESMEQMSIGETGSGATVSVQRRSGPKAHHKAKGKGNRADQFCVYRTSDGRNVPVLAIEYKAPHKLTIDEVITGLESEIQPERDVINKDGEGFAFAAKALTAAVVTQLFSYMIGKSIQYGYVCTGEAFVFLHIPDNPTIVYYYVCVPNLDVLDDDETRLHRTAAAQVFAFVLQALRAAPPPMSWHDEAKSLDTWVVEFDDVLSKIPATVRKEARSTPYKAQRWQGFKRSPIRTRSYCQQLLGNVKHRGDDDDEEGPPSPTPGRSTRSGKKAVTSSTATGSDQKRGQRSGGNRRQGQTTQQTIHSRPFCTQKCILGLAYGGPMDTNCPNFDDHGQRHIDRLEFLRLIRTQLATDRGRDADCMPLYLSGSLGSLFKVRLSSHGYVLVAKGMERFYLGRLRHENELYDRLRALQGKHVPVCLGRVDLILPYYYDGGVFEHFMFLSWAGRPVFKCINQLSQPGVVDAVTTAFKELHTLGVLHCDAEPRNILYDADRSNLMVVDFERAKFYDRQPLGSISPNGQKRRGKRGMLQKQEKDDMSQKQEKDDFAQELQFAVDSVSRCFGRGSCPDKAR